MESAENDDRLRGVEADVGAFVDEIEDQAGDPTYDVAQQARDVFGHRLRRGRGARRRRAGGRTWGGARCRLRRTATRAKGSIIGDNGSALRAMCHDILPGKAIAAETIKNPPSGASAIRKRGDDILKLRRGSGGIGRRASLRSWWPKGRRGSSPFFRTNISGREMQSRADEASRGTRVTQGGAVDAHRLNAYTEFSVAARFGRSPLISSLSDSEQAKGGLKPGSLGHLPARKAF